MNHIDIVEIKAAVEGIMELAIPHAKAVHVYFEALTKEGFTDDQALKIVMKHGYCPPSVGNNGGDENK